MADCYFISNAALIEAKKKFGHNIYRLISKYGGIENIPDHHIIKDYRSASDLDTLYKRITSESFHDVDAFYNKAIYKTIKKNKDGQYEFVTPDGNRIVIPTYDLANLPDYELGGYEVEKKFFPNEYTKRYIQKVLEDNNIHPVSVLYDIYPIFALKQQVSKLQVSLLNLSKKHADIEAQEASSGTSDNSRSNEILKQITDIGRQINDLNQQINEIRNKPAAQYGLMLVSETEVEHNLSHISDLSLYTPVPHSDIRYKSIMKDFLVLRNNETGAILLVHPYSKNYNNRKADRLGENIFPKEVAKELDMYANESNLISLKMYLAALETVQNAESVEGAMSINVFGHGYLDAPAPHITLEIPVFNQRFSATFDYILQTLNDDIFAQRLKTAREMLGKDTPKTLSDDEEVEFFRTRLNQLKTFSDKDKEEYLERIKNGDYNYVLEKLLSIAKTKRKSKNKVLVETVVTLINTIREKNLSEELRTHIYDDPSITMWIKDANQIDNYWIQSVMDFINEKLFITKEELLPVYNKINRLAHDIVKEKGDIALRGKVNPNFSGGEFFKNLIVKSGERAGRYIYVEPSTESSWANSEENKRGWSKLTEAEKEFSRLFVQTIKKAYSEAFSEEQYAKNWEDGLIPIMKKKEGFQLIDAIKEGNLRGIGDALLRSHMHQTDFNQTFTETSSMGGVPNYYMYMNKDEHAELYYKAVNDFGAVEQDLYSVLLQTTTNLTKKKNFDKIEGYFQLVKTMAEKQTQDDGITQNNNTLNMLNAIYEKYFLQRNRKINTGNRRYNNVKTIRNILTKSGVSNVDIDNIFATISKYSSLLTVALSPINDLKNFTQGFLRAFSRGLSGTLTRLYGGNAPFTVKELLEGYQFVFSAIGDKRKRELLSQILKVSNMYQSDLTDFSTPRYKETDVRAYLFRSNVFFMLNYLGDYANRGAVAYATINKEIGMEAYSVDEYGQLVYDKTKDKRYQTEEGRQIIAFIQSQSQGGKYGIDYRMASNMKRISNETFGSYDSETLRLAEMYSLGRLLLQFRRYLPDYLYEAWGRGKYVRVNGSYKIVNGKVVWEGEYFEGIMRSMIWAINARLFNKSKMVINHKMSEKRKQNMYKLLSDIMFFAAVYALYILFSGALDDDDEKGDYGIFGNRKNKDRFYGMAFDFVQTINPNVFFSMLNSPFAAGKTLNKILAVFNNLWKAVFYGYIKDDDKKEQRYYNAFEEGIYKTVPYVSSAYRFKTDMEDILWDTSDVQYQ
ncbi:MAG: hypothetical protein RML94_00030 [Bacteroidia bacterium]|nr:hypothetical protein [Bacteroidia bacterium]